MSEKAILYGWYSAKALESGQCILPRRQALLYSTPSGGQVIVTAVGPKGGDWYKWPDKKPLGRVDKYIGVAP